MADLSRFDRGDHLFGRPQHGLVAEADGDGLSRLVGGKAAQGNGLGDQRGKIPAVGDVHYPGQATRPVVKMRSM